MKDWLIEKTVPTVLNERVLKPYGTLTEFKFDSKLRTAEGQILLKGERDPIRIRIGSYELVNENGRTFIIIHEFISSREWITRLAQQFVLGRRYELPESIAKYVVMIA